LVRRHHLQRYLVLSDPPTEQAQSPFLLEVEHPGPADPACSSPEACDSGPDPGLGEDPQAERQRGRTDVESPLEFERRPDRIHVLIGELAMPPVSRLDGWEQAKRLPVAEHSGRCAELPRGLGDAHEPILTFFCQERGGRGADPPEPPLRF